MTHSQTKTDAHGPPYFGRRQQVTLLVIVHLDLALNAVAANSWLEARLYKSELGLVNNILLAGIFGFQVGQLVLLASWAAFADQPWLLRIPRFLALFAWTELFSLCGEHLFGRPFAWTLVEEHAAQTCCLLVAPLLVLIGFQVPFGRRFIHRDSSAENTRWQFSTRRLLLVTAEVSALLALGRVVIPANFHWDEFRTALSGSRWEEIMPSLVSVSILPVVLIALTVRQNSLKYLAIGSYLVLASTLLSSLHQWYLFQEFGSSTAWNGWPEIPLAIGEYACVHLSAAATILFTLGILRRLGYDFRRRDDGPLPKGRSSSNARNSAASASA